MKNVYYIINLGLSRITPAGLLVKARNMVSKLTVNIAFPTPTPALATVTTECDELEKAINAYDLNPGPGELTDRDIAFGKVKGLVSDLGGYVQAVSNGDLELIKSAGCVVRKSATPLGELPPPAQVIARTTAFAGRIDVRWSGVKGRNMYELEMCSTDPSIAANWSRVLLTSKNRHISEDLVSGTNYYFRVKAMGAAGVSPASDVATAKAA